MKFHIDLSMREVVHILFCRKCLFWSCLLLNLFCRIGNLQADTDSLLKQKEDSLLTILSRVESPEQKIDLLRNLASINKHTTQETVYSMQLFEIANRLDSTQGCYEALFNLSRYYCNTFNLDSVRYWVHKIDSITTVHKEAPEELFLSHNALCRLYLLRGEFEEAMNEAVRLQIIAERTDNQLGLAYCNENWGLTYMFTNRFEEAAEAFESCLSIIKGMEDQRIYQTQVNECLIRTYLYLKDYPKAEKAIDFQDHTLKIIMQNKLNYNSLFDDEAYFIMELYRIRLYSEMNMPEKSIEVLNRITITDEYLSKTYIIGNYHLGMATYYYKTRNYQKAEEFINKPMDIDIPYFELKVAILTALGKKREVLEVYQQFMEFSKSEREIAYTRQINKLRSLQYSQEEERVVQELSLQKKEIENKHNQLLTLIGISLILLFTIAIWIWYLVKTKRLKDDLEKEQSTLKETKQDLLIAKERAEKADKMKSNFIANISHEIREPLNAIAESTSKLEASSQEDRAHHINTIRLNSDVLLKLVSEVLSISHISDPDSH